MKKLLTIILVLCTLTGFAQATGNSPYDPGAARKNLSNVDALQLKLGAGTAAAPAYTFSSDPDTGIYSPAVDRLAFTLGGAEKFAMVGTRLEGVGNMEIGPDTEDTADSNVLELCGGGDNDTSRGSIVNLLGNEVATYGGQALFYAGNVATGKIVFYTANLERATIASSGNVLIATSIDDTVNKLQVNGSMRLIGMAAPTATEGGVYFNSSDKHLYVYNGTGWVQLDN